MNSLLACLLLSASLPLGATRIELSAGATPKQVAPGAKTELTFDFSVQPGWHIYSPDYKGVGKPTEVTVEPGPYSLDSKLSFPEPVKRRDEILDEEVRYHAGKFRYTQAIRLKPDAPAGKLKITGKIGYMSCSEVSCDPPAELAFSTEIEVLAAVAPETPPAPPPLPGLKPVTLPGLGGTKKPLKNSPVTLQLAVEPASAAAGGNATLVLSYEIAPGNYIYGPDNTSTLGIPTKLTLDPKQARVEGAATSQPPSKEKEELGEKLRILEKKGEIRQAIVLDPKLAPGKTQLDVAVEYMVCDAKTCTQEEWKGSAAIEVLAAAAAPAVPERNKPAREPEKAPAGPPAQARGNAFGGLWGLIAQAIFWGVITVLMPCTYPMIPLTISFFAKQGASNQRAATKLAAAYGAGIVLDFILIGLVVGPPIQKLAFDPWMNSAFTAVFVAFGLSMLGLFEIRLPSSVLQLSGRASSVGGYFGVFLLGATFVVTSFTCSAPFIGIMLAPGAHELGALEITLGMGVFGATVAAPFVALAFFPQKAKALPRSGEWMHTLKVTLGLVELVAALKFVSNVDLALGWRSLPQELFCYLCAALLGVTALYLFGVIKLSGESGSISPLRLTWAIGFLVFSTYFAVCATVPRQTLNFVAAAFIPPYSSRESVEQADAGAVRTPKHPWTLVKDQWEEGLAQAKAEKKLALVNWTGFQ